jgi:hypothetical protein
VEQARALMLRDPSFVENGVFELQDVRAWNIFVDELTPRDRLTQQ